jgi:hypothetical protein
MEDRVPQGTNLGGNSEVPWRCFHCDEVMETPEAAAEHFGNGNYECEMPLCIEAASAEQKALVLTNREMWERIQKLDIDLEAAEFQRDCWEAGARKFLEAPNASWHDLANYRETAEGRVLAAEAAINAAPRWLANWLRRRAERQWRAANLSPSEPPNKGVSDRD